MHPNDPLLKSFIDVAADAHFPIQNLPFGVFSTAADRMPRVGVAIGEWVLDLAVLERARLLPIAPAGQKAFDRTSLNAFVSLGRVAWSEARKRVSELLRHDNPVLRDDLVLRQRALTPQSAAILHLPITVSGYTDFYSSKEH